MFASKLTARRENRVDLKNKTYPELRELLERQDRILSDSCFVNRLPDKGEKLKNFRAQIEVELAGRRRYDKLCEDMGSLDVSKSQLDTLEWTGKQRVPDVNGEHGRLNVDDDRDVLKMFVTHSGIHRDKIFIKEKSEAPLIRPSDLIEEKPAEPTEQQKNDEYENFHINVECYAKNLCGRIDKRSTMTGRTHLLLNKPIKPSVHSAVKAKSMTLKESVMLQILHENKLKDMEKERSVQRSFDKFKTANYRDARPIIAEVTSDEDDDNDDVISNDDEY